MPVSIFIGAERLMIEQRSATSRPSMNGNGELKATKSDLNGCLETLRIIHGVNSLAEHYRHLLESGDLSDLGPLLS